MTEENKEYAKILFKEYLSLKQKEQRKGYLEANEEDKTKKDVVSNFTKIFSNDGKGSLIVDNNNDIKQTK